LNNEKKRPSLVDEYKKIKRFYESYTKKIEALIKTLIDESEIQVHSITPRTKEVESVSRKISSKIETYNKVSDITDLSGVRICCYFSSQLDKVAALIKENFIIIPELSIDKRKTIDPDRFGYLSLHYVVKLSVERANLPEYKKYKDLLCEIQVRTILQHAWAEIEHDLGYKANIGIPRKIRRQFSRLAGLLELADEQFDNIKLQVEDYSKEIEKKIAIEPKEVAIDNISMEAYILTSPLIKDLDEKIAKIANWLIVDEANTEFGVRMSNYFNIKSIQELDSRIIKVKEDIVNFAKIYFKDQIPVGAIMNRGISLFYLGYLLISQSKNIDKIKDYLKSMKIASEEYWDAVAVELVDAANEIDKGKT